MPLLSGPFLAISALLVVAGVMKLRRPAFTAGALSAVGLPGSDTLVRLLGVTEIVVGVAAAASGARLWALAVAVFYMAFALFVAHALRRRTPIATCGCFGSPDTPPTVGHLVLNLGSAAAALVVAWRPVGRFVGLPALDPWTGVAFLIFSAATVYLMYAIVNVLPQRRRLSRERPVAIGPRPGVGR